MPCSGDYMNATNVEIEHGRLLLVFDEVFKGETITPKAWADAGYDKRVYGHPLTDSSRDYHTQQICQAIRSAGNIYLQALSLEAQLWWRDHQAADRAREKHEKTRNWSA